MIRSGTIPSVLSMHARAKSRPPLDMSISRRMWISRSSVLRERGVGRPVRLASQVTERTLDGVLVWPNLDYGRDLLNGCPNGRRPPKKEVCLPWCGVNDSGNRLLHTGIDLSVRVTELARSASQPLRAVTGFSCSRRTLLFRGGRSGRGAVRSTCARGSQGGQPPPSYLAQIRVAQLNSSSTSRSST